MQITTHNFVFKVHHTIISLNKKNFVRFVLLNSYGFFIFFWILCAYFIIIFSCTIIRFFGAVNLFLCRKREPRFVYNEYRKLLYKY